jgi:flagellar basal body-associated protein FliL
MERSKIISIILIVLVVLGVLGGSGYGIYTLAKPKSSFGKTMVVPQKTELDLAIEKTQANIANQEKTLKTSKDLLQQIKNTSLVSSSSTIKLDNSKLIETVTQTINDTTNAIKIAKDQLEFLKKQKK